MGTPHVCPTPTNTPILLQKSEDVNLFFESGYILLFLDNWKLMF